MVTQTDIDTLNAAIARGEKTVLMGSKSVTYRSVRELIAARDDMAQQLAAQQAKESGRFRPKMRRIYARSRGY